MELLPQIDKKATKDKAREVLESYRGCKRRLIGASIDPYSLMRSPEYSDMPAHRSNTNGVEKTIVYKLRNVSPDVRDDERVKCIDVALKALSEVSSKILDLYYINPNKYTLYDVAAKLEITRVNKYGDWETKTYSVKRIEQLLEIALYEFAEAYRCENLIVYKPSRKN